MASKRRADEDVTSTSDTPNAKKHLTVAGIPVSIHDGEPSSSASSRLHEDPSKKPMTLSDEKYFGAYSDLLVHQDMINDHIRTNTYRRAIIQNYDIFYNKIVLDVGCGTGILSLFCIKAGAKKVYAVDASPIIEQTRKVVQSNNVESRVILIRGRIEDVELPEKVDVIVSEWMGYMLFYESMLPSVLHARDRWLKPGGLMFPNSAKLFMAPVSDYETFDDRVHFWENLKEMYNVDMSAIMSFAKHKLIETVHVHSVNGEDIQAHKTVLKELNLSEAVADDVRVVKKPFEFRCFGHNTVHGFALWFSVTFPGDFILSTSPYDSDTHWQQTVIFINPIRVCQDTLIHGHFTVGPNATNPRFQDIELQFQVDGGELRNYSYMMGDNII